MLNQLINLLNCHNFNSILNEKQWAHCIMAFYTDKHSDLNEIDQVNDLLTRPANRSFRI